MKHMHAFHLVDKSPWPFMASLAALGITFGLVNWFYFSGSRMMLISLLSLGMVAIQWWRDVSREGTLQGCHSSMVVTGLRWGMVLFITSEVFFFLAFFWTFFHSSLSPCIEVGLIWPPKSIFPFNPMQVPLLNSVVLLTSGVSVTWCHHSILDKSHSESVCSLLMTVVLGVYFTVLQGYEYLEASFSIADSVYGSIFFVATGFHGLHVIIGSVLLSVMLVRLLRFQFSGSRHFGFEAAAWYWHFVDVVWLFLYVSVYWWSFY